MKDRSGSTFVFSEGKINLKIWFVIAEKKMGNTAKYLKSTCKSILDCWVEKVITRKTEKVIIIMH
jgi:hypothetical protein